MTRRLFAALTGIALAALMASSAFAYVGTITAIDVTAPATATSGVPITVSATLLDSAGAALAGEPVTWSFTTTAGSVSFSKGTSTTNASGVATTQATIVCEACTVTFVATVDDSNGSKSASVNVTVAGSGLPNTSTTMGFSTSSIATLLAVFAVIAGVGLILRQVIVSRR